MTHSGPCRFELVRDGVRLVGDAQGPVDAPITVLVHGYPDDARLWRKVAPLLVGTLRVVTYDVRGAGRSSAPRRTAAYSLEQLVADLRAVIDEVSPVAPVHLVGHDWGAIQGWEAVTRADLAPRIASFTAMSAPSFDLVGHLLRRRLRRPSGQDIRKLTRQLAASWYLAFFQLPVLPEVLWHRRLAARWPALLERVEGIPRTSAVPRADLAATAANGVRLYRANLHRILRPCRDRILVPVVRVLTGGRDRAVTPAVFDDLERHAAIGGSVTVEVVPDAGHFLPLTHPELVADHVIAVTLQPRG